jgi:mannosyl-3-phosphoglycerate phosphatase
VEANLDTAYLVLTDLDGTLLDPLTYSFEAARPALAELKRRPIPVILVSSKTRAELEPIRAQLDNQDPFVVENGGGVFIPKGMFNFTLEEAVLRDGYQLIERGTAYGNLRAALRDIAACTGCTLRGFGDMSVAEVMSRTGLAHADAVLAKQRAYDEPFVIVGLTDANEYTSEAEHMLRRVQQEAESRGLFCSVGGRFSHLHGSHDKGQACRYLINCYRRAWGRNRKLVTIALGDSQNDLPMLAEVDHAVLIQHADGSYDPDIRLPNLFRAEGTGPVGWNAAISTLIGTT